MKLILPLDVTFPLKTKKDRCVKYSLNSFLLDLSDKSWGNKRKPNHAYQFKAKRHLQQLVKDQIADLKPLEGPWPKQVTLTIYRGSNRHMDIIDNPIMLTKFAMDIVKINHCPDDDWRYFSKSTIVDGGLNRENPHATLEISDII